MAQILKKFIGDNQVADEKIRLDNNSFLRSRNAANSADINIVKVNASDALELGATLNAGAFEITNLGAPTGPNSAATKTYVDTAISAVGAGALYARAASASNVTISNPGTAVFDGVTLTTGQLLLLTGQTAPAQNGLYVFDTSSTPLVRATSLDASAEFTIGKLVVVLEGTTYGDSLWALQAAVATVGTDPVDFDQLSGGGGGGANQTLSNLNSPTAINEDLIFDGGNQLKTKNDSALTSDLYIRSGDSSADSSGQVVIESGSTSTDGFSTGDVTVQSKTTAASDASTGALNLKTGDAAGNGNAGNITIQTGEGAAGASGGLSLVTGNSVSGTAGDISLATGTNGTDLGNITATGKNVTLSGGSNGGEFSVTSFATTNFNALPLSNVADPSSAQDAATKAYVDAAVPTFDKYLKVLDGTDITNQYLDLPHVAKTGSIHFNVRGGPPTQEGASYDYSVNYTGGAGGNTRITFLNDLATGGASPLAASDVVQVLYAR